MVYILCWCFCFPGYIKPPRDGLPYGQNAFKITINSSSFSFAFLSTFNFNKCLHKNIPHLIRFSFSKSLFESLLLYGQCTIKWAIKPGILGSIKDGKMMEGEREGARERQNIKYIHDSNHYNQSIRENSKSLWQALYITQFHNTLLLFSFLSFSLLVGCLVQFSSFFIIIFILLEGKKKANDSYSEM